MRKLIVALAVAIPVIGLVLIATLGSTGRAETLLGPQCGPVSKWTGKVCIGPRGKAYCPAGMTMEAETCVGGNTATATSPMTTATVSDQSLVQRVNALAQQTAALTAQVQQLQQQLAQYKADTDKNFVDDRFRITALEATNKVSTGNDLSTLKSAVATLQTNNAAVINTLEANKSMLGNLSSGLGTVQTDLNTLSMQFKNHTHTYKLTNFGVEDGKVIPPFQIGEYGVPTQSSPPVTH
jgi:hypothetical protein